MLRQASSCQVIFRQGAKLADADHHSAGEPGICRTCCDTPGKDLLSLQCSAPIRVTPIGSIGEPLQAYGGFEKGLELTARQPRDKFPFDIRCCLTASVFDDIGRRTRSVARSDRI
jgi:hypothetical protein